MGGPDKMDEDEKALAHPRSVLSPAARPCPNSRRSIGIFREENPSRPGGKVLPLPQRKNTSGHGWTPPGQPRRRAQRRKPRPSSGTRRFGGKPAAHRDFL